MWLQREQDRARRTDFANRAVVTLTVPRPHCAGARLTLLNQPHGAQDVSRVPTAGPRWKASPA